MRMTVKNPANLCYEKSANFWEKYFHSTFGSHRRKSSIKFKTIFWLILKVKKSKPELLKVKKIKFLSKLEFF